ncbi:uncharacterized protein LOC107371036 [Tetranychus urticae]|uniref:Uncharacterized protein n=1 Tax=Tetranychus urticae TaxID=32264 RepID=T1L650_TETUR|nr:uncharacterized protein LOC107371036 [Tetranychus urticae]
MSTYTNNSRTRPRFRDRAKNQMNKFKSAVSSALPSVTSFGSSEFERHPRVWESLVTSGIVALFTLNVVFLYPLVYGGFLNVIYPPWTAPEPTPAEMLNIKSPNVLRSIIDRLNEVTVKFTKYCYENNKLSEKCV